MIKQFLEAQLAIEQTRLKAQRNYVFNSSMQILANVTEKVVNEIKNQIEQLEKKKEVSNG